MTVRSTSLLLALALLGLAACGRREEPRRTDGHTSATTPAKPRPYEPAPQVGYEGYSLLFDSGLAHILTAQPEGVGGAPHLYLLDREGKTAGEVFGSLLGDYEGKGQLCEGTLTEAGPYLAWLAKYDFSARTGHRSRLLLLDRQTLKLLSNRQLAQPGRGDGEWVRQSLTLEDGSTFLCFDKRSYYLLPRQGQELTQLSLPVAYPKAAYGWQKHGYFFLEEATDVQQVEAGKTTVQRLPLLTSGTIQQVWPVGGQWLVVRDTREGYHFFDMATGRVVFRFHLTERVGRTMAYDPATRRLFFSGDKPLRTSADAKERTIFFVTLPEAKGSEPEGLQTLQAETFYRLPGRSESDNTLGMQMQLGLQPERRLLFVSWLDAGRGTPRVRTTSKTEALPLDDAPVTAKQSYTWDGASDIRGIFTLSRTK